MRCLRRNEFCEKQVESEVEACKEKVQAEARAQARLYHLSGPLALGRDFGMRALGAERLLKRYDWLYGA